MKMTGRVKITFREAQNEVEMASNDLEDIEALKATTKVHQKKLSDALNRARKAEKAKAKSTVSLLLGFPKFLVGLVGY